MAKYEIIDGMGIIPEGTTIVEGDFLQSAFEDHESLTSIVIPDSVTMIGDGAFSFYTGLKTINVPAKKADYYKKLLPEELHSLIVELPAEKNAKK